MRYGDNFSMGISANYALQNHGRYSPNLLVFGTKLNIPSVITG